MLFEKQWTFLLKIKFPPFSVWLSITSPPPPLLQYRTSIFRLHNLLLPYVAESQVNYRRQSINCFENVYCFKHGNRLSPFPSVTLCLFFHFHWFHNFSFDWLIICHVTPLYRWHSRFKNGIIIATKVIQSEDKIILYTTDHLHFLTKPRLTGNINKNNTVLVVV